MGIQHPFCDLNISNWWRLRQSRDMLNATGGGGDGIWGAVRRMLTTENHSLTRWLAT